MARPILAYAAETRADTSKTSQILETTEMKTLRRLTNVTRLDRVRSETVRECLIRPIGTPRIPNFMNKTIIVLELFKSEK